jgi:hypothetical protein
MKKRLNVMALALVLTFAGAGFAAPAKAVKTSAAHKAAVKKCNMDYGTAIKDARTKKGKERKEAEASAKQARKQCIADAPK